MNLSRVFVSFVALSGLAIVSSCQREAEVPESNLHEVVFHAGWDPETRTVLQGDGSVWWEPGDEISLFFLKWNENEDGSGYYSMGGLTGQSLNNEEAKEADFAVNTENLFMNYGLTSLDGIDSFYSVYPSCDNNYFWCTDSGNTIFLNCSIPTVQIAKVDSFDHNAFVSYAESHNGILYFRNVLGGVKFSVSQDGIKEVLFKYSSGDMMSGQLSFRYKGEEVITGSAPPQTNSRDLLSHREGESIMSELSLQSRYGPDYVIVRAPENSFFEKGKYYYAVMCPTENDSPLTVTYKKENSSATFFTSGPTTIKRSVFKRLYNKDANLTFIPNKDEAVIMSMLPHYLQNVANDPNADTITGAYFHPSSNHVTDENLGTDEAPVYFELDGTEVHYYTPKESFNIKNVSSRMFSGWHSLTTVDLTGVDASESTDFGECFSETNLKSIDLSNFDTSNATSMKGMFSQCKSLESLDLSSFNTEHVTDMSSMFYLCRNLRELDLCSFDTSHCLNMGWMFCYCISLQKLDLANFDVSAVNSSDYMSYLIATHKKNCVIRASETTKSLLCDEVTAKMPKASKDYFITWISPSEDFPPLTDPFADQYKSTDYSKDMTYSLAQSASRGKGIDIVIMGDAYSDRLINDGTYDTDLGNAIEQLFSEEPLKSMRDYFNVYITYVISENETFSGVTALDLVFEDFSTNISGNGSTIDDYMRATLPDYGHESLVGRPVPYIIVIANTNRHAGTCEFYTSGSTIAYSTLGQNEIDFHTIVCHEFGHALGRLADEYDEYGWTFMDHSRFQDSSAEGFWPNVDITNDPDLVKWNHLLKDGRYAEQGLGIFEGGFTYYAYGIWRPTENSIMNTATTGFNAPCREAVYKRVNELADDTFVYDYESFVAFDQKAMSGASKPNKIRMDNLNVAHKLPPPVFIKGTNNPNGASTTIKH